MLNGVLTSPATLRRFGWSRVIRLGSRAIAVTTWPRSNAWRVRAKPVRPEAARMVRCMPRTLLSTPINIKCNVVNR